jgi:hypothetical protein
VAESHGAQTDPDTRRNRAAAVEESRLLFDAQEGGVDNHLDAGFDVIGEVGSEGDPVREPALYEPVQIPAITSRAA